MLAASPMYADQLMQKNVSKTSKQNAVPTMQAKKAPAKANAKGVAAKGFDRVRKAATPGLRKAKSVASTPKTNRPVMRAEGSYPEIYGSISYTGDPSFAEYGVYSVPTSSSQQFELVQAMAADANYGGAYKDGHYYLMNYYDLWGFIQMFYAYDYDMETGELVSQVDLSDDPQALCPGGMAYDPLTGELYGMTFTADLSGQELAKLTFTGTSVEKDVVYSYGDSHWFNAFAIDGQGQFYAIEADLSGEGILYKVDRSTGALTKVGPTGEYPYYISGACIDAKSGRMFWALSPEDETGYLTEVDLTTGAATVIYMFPYDDELTGLYTPTPSAEDGAPDACTNVEANFSAGSLTGTVTFTAPSTTFDGGSLTGNLTVTLLVNGQESATTTVAAGANGSFDVTVPGAGSYDFTVYATNSVGNGPKTTVKSVYVGSDTPAATTATAKYENGNMEITWLPVTEGVNGGYIDPTTISYTVKVAGGETLATGLTVTSYSYELAMPDNITAYTYEVYVVTGDLTSAPARTNTVMLGSIVPPYVADFKANGLEGWTVIDANNDLKVWTVQADGSVRMTYNSSKDMDDWLITPPLKLEAGKGYNVSFVAANQSSSFPERLEVMWGADNTAAGMTNTLLAPTDITTSSSDGGQAYSEMLVPSADGIYYIGFHGISDADEYYLYLSDIQIEAGVSAAAPGMATNLTATSVQAGSDWNVNVSFTAPDLTMAEDALTSLTKVELLRGETVINTWNNPTPGTALSFVDTTPGNGNVTYTVIGYNAEGAGLKATVDVFVGFDLPVAPAVVNIATTDVEGQVVLTWTAVTEDVNGTALTANDVKYIVCEYNGGWTPIAEDITATTYSYQAVPAGEQDFVQLAVFAETTAGVGSGTASDMIPAGTPYNGINETFADGKLAYIWGIEGDAQANIGTDSTFSDLTSANGDNGYIYLQANYFDYYGSLFSGLISLEQLVNPGLTFYTYNVTDGENPDINEITVAVKEAGATEWTTVLGPTTVDELCDGVQNEWGKVSVPLGAYANKTIQIKLTGVVKYYTTTFFDDIKVGSILGNDLAVTGITAPSKVKAGDDYTVQVGVSNEGAQNATSFSVELYADNELFATETVDALESGKSVKVNFDLTMSPLATEAIAYYAKVVYAADENAANNQTASLTVTPVVSTLPTATDLEGESTADGVQLTWSEPNLEGGVAEPVTDDFEDGDAFAAEYGDWTFVDVDNSQVGGFQNMDIPGITPGTTTGSFWIWDNTVANGNQTFDAHSGNNYLFALFRYDDGQSDDWAISPELTGDAQTISFYAKSYSSSYPEKMQVYYSTGSKSPSDFVAVSGTLVNAVPDSWTLYEAELPAGAKYFAIRSFATGSFMLMVDDVTYTPAGSTANLEIAGYNVYRDGEKLNDTLLEETTYTDTTAVDGETYTYVVTVVYTDKGESAASNEVVIKADSSVESVVATSAKVTVEGNSIVVTGADALNVTVFNTAGVTIFNGMGDTRVEVAGGVYLVKVGNAVTKVYVK